MERNPTLLDWTQAVGPDSQIAAVIELLHQTNEVLADWTFMEGNLPTGHQTSIRTGLPSVTWRRLYGGVQPDKSTRAKVVDTVGNLEAYNEVDKDLADLNGNSAAFRTSEARAQIESMSQAAARTLFYGNTAVEPEKFDGFAPRYSDLSAPNADNIIDAGGSGSDNTSIWLICWDENTCHGIVPKGSQAGLQVDDKGQVTIEDVDGNGGRMEAYRTHFQWKLGLTVRDWRYVVRIANIDKSALAADPASGGTNLPDLMFEAMERLPASIGNCAFYMARNTRTKLRQQLTSAVKNSSLTFEDVGGHKAMMFQELPVRRADVLATDEARVT